MQKKSPTPLNLLKSVGAEEKLCHYNKTCGLNQESKRFRATVLAERFIIHWPFGSYNGPLISSRLSTII